MSVLDHANMSKMDIARSRVERIGIGINDRSLREWSWRYHPFPARDLGLEEAKSEDGNHGDWIEDRDQQHHDVDHVDIELVVGDSDHQLEADPVDQGQGPRQLCIPWTPKPIGSARRRRGCLIRQIRFGNFLHMQSLSGKRNSTDHGAAKPPAALARCDEAVRSCCSAFPSSHSPLPALPFPVGICGRIPRRAGKRP
jgi:hypothetical protein